MLAIALLSLLAAPLLSVSAVPQYGYGAPAATTPAALATTTAPAASAAATYTVKVGSANGTLAFSPESISAVVGDQVIFEFHQKNHTATQSSFASPCGQLAGGFDTGFEPVGANQTSGFPTATYTVTSTKATWFFCAQGDGAHCAAGMVFAINCGAEGSANSFSSFKAAAMATKPGSNPYTPNPSSGQNAGSADAAYTPTVVTQVITLDAQTWTTTYSSYPGSPNPTPASLTGVKHTVIVGGNSTLTFDPPNLVAQPRDQIVFEFHSKNHTATQSSFASPCSPLTAQAGFDSGFMPVSATAASASQFPTFTVTVNDTSPIWVYCKQTGHCGQGMVFAVNSDEEAGSTHSFSAFQTLAKQVAATNTSSPTTTGPTGYGSSAAAPRATTTKMAAVLVGVLGVVLGLTM